MEGREPIFQNDVMKLNEINPHWTKEALLKQECLFFLKGVCKKLDVDSEKLKRSARTIGFDRAWSEMGLRKIWSHWVVRMVVFGKYYEKHLIPKYRTVESCWNANQLLEQEGLFLLADACKILPFGPYQLRYQAIKAGEGSRETLGVFKDPDTQRYLVDMKVFRGWVTQVWLSKERSFG